MEEAHSTATREAQRKSRTRHDPAPANEAEPQAQPKDFEEHLGDARVTPKTARDSETPAQDPAQSPKPAPRTSSADAQAAQPAVEAKTDEELALPLLVPTAPALPVADRKPSPAAGQAAATSEVAGSSNTASAANSAPAPLAAAAAEEGDANAQPAAGDERASVDSSSEVNSADALPPRVHEAASTNTSAIPAQPRSETPAISAPKLAPAPPPAPPTPADTERAADILRQMRVQLSPGLRTATIQLTPVDLGRITIRMHVDAGELRAVVRAEKRETLEALERHVPELKATLDQLGIQTRQLDLQLGFEHQGAQPDPRGAQPHAGQPTQREIEQEARVERQRLIQTLAAQSGGIDTYA
ncbi:MAG: flagellar hook-length control protein FliK [Planctomycetes bacterium]|nr:flagellar hook-length control protein FliK [Planctomycetota bacterium]